MEIIFVSDTSQNIQFPNVCLSLMGTDLFVLTEMTDREARKYGTNGIKQIQKMLEGLLGSIQWEIQKDVPMRRLRLEGMHSLVPALADGPIIVNPPIPQQEERKPLTAS